MNSFDDFEIRFESSNEIFGLCDDENNNEVAYLDEGNGGTWIATVHNVHQEEVLFFPIDHCNLIPRLADGREPKQCDGLLKFNESIAFVELKSRSGRKSRQWIDKAEEQLRVSIDYFRQFGFISSMPNKKAYVVNSQRPKAYSSEAMRAEKFQKETGFLLRIKAHIYTDEQFSKETRGS